MREEAVQTLAAITPVPPAAARALTLALRDASLDLDTRQAAVDALANVKPPTPEAVDGLMFALKDPSNTIDRRPRRHCRTWAARQAGRPAPS